MFIFGGLKLLILIFISDVTRCRAILQTQYEQLVIYILGDEELPKRPLSTRTSSARLQGKGETREHTINFVGASKEGELSRDIHKGNPSSSTFGKWTRMAIEELLRLNWQSREAIVPDDRLDPSREHIMELLRSQQEDELVKGLGLLKDHLLKAPRHREETQLFALPLVDAMDAYKGSKAASDLISELLKEHSLDQWLLEGLTKAIQENEISPTGVVESSQESQKLPTLVRAVTRLLSLSRLEHIRPKLLKGAVMGKVFDAVRACPTVVSALEDSSLSEKSLEEARLAVQRLPYLVLKMAKLLFTVEGYSQEKRTMIYWLLGLLESERLRSDVFNNQTSDADKFPKKILRLILNLSTQEDMLSELKEAATLRALGSIMPRESMTKDSLRLFSNLIKAGISPTLIAQTETFLHGLLGALTLSQWREELLRIILQLVEMPGAEVLMTALMSESRLFYHWLKVWANSGKSDPVTDLSRAILARSLMNTTFDATDYFRLGTRGVMAELCRLMEQDERAVHPLENLLRRYASINAPPEECTQESAIRLIKNGTTLAVKRDALLVLGHILKFRKGWVADQQFLQEHILNFLPKDTVKLTSLSGEEPESRAISLSLSLLYKAFKRHGYIPPVDRLLPLLNSSGLLSIYYTIRLLTEAVRKDRASCEQIISRIQEERIDKGIREHPDKERSEWAAESLNNLLKTCNERPLPSEDETLSSIE